MPAQGFKPQSILHQPEESLKALAQIGHSNGQVNPSRPSKSKHKLKSFHHLDSPTQLHRVKVPAQFDRQEHFQSAATVLWPAPD
jgi:hypothetical protein